MRTNPEPENGVIVAQTQSAIVLTNANGEDRLSLANTFEEQSVRIGVDLP
jgi:hypothetical protein